jgi:hypothetical protein
MGTLWSELGPVAESVTDRPRVYADANVPAGIVAFMREKLHWDVLFVMDQPDLRRARDIEHFRLARQLRRTLVTLDRDYLDDRQRRARDSGARRTRPGGAAETAAHAFVLRQPFAA